MYKQEFTARRGQPLFLLVGTILAFLLASSPIAVPTFAEYRHGRLINSNDYKQIHGYWETIELPEEFRINTIHAALLPTGKVLLVAGSGNNRQSFNEFHDSGVISNLKTIVFDPLSRDVKAIETPSDLFCSGHALMQTGNLIIAGGTSGYELLGNNVKKPAGVITLHNEDPDSKTRTFKKGTKFISEKNKVYVSTKDVVLPPASKVDHGEGDVMIHHSASKVFIEAVSEDESYVSSTEQKFSVEGLEGTDLKNIYGQGGLITLNKQDYRGDNKSYEFDPVQEKYIKTGDLNEDRWYPSLPVMTNGEVLAVSGLDGAGTITETTEKYDATTKKWSWGPDQAFPTYPALFRTNNPNVLFYSGSSAGYGPQDKGREPGFWNVKEDSFQPVPGLRDADITETSASLILPPPKGSNDGSQSTRIMIAGGGGIGESALTTSRTDIIDLADSDPRYSPGPDLPEKLRYINMAVLPSDEVFASGGTKNYRAKGNSYTFKTSMINPTTNSVSPMAEEAVGRGYHSGSLLLPDGRVLTFGNDPLYADKENSKAGIFDQRISIFTPPQLTKGKRPVLEGSASLQAKRGEQLSFKTGDTAEIKTARLIPPSSSTHVTNTEQRSIGAIVKGQNGMVTVDLPKDENVLTNGWYMLFFVNKDGTPSQAKMVQVVP